MSENLVSKKDEIYTFFELDSIGKLVAESSVNEKNHLIEVMQKLSGAVESNKNGMGVFFMPENTFAVFSIFQGDNTICKVQTEELDAILIAVKENSLKFSSKLITHLTSKLQVLLDFMKKGNIVHPVPSAADSLVSFE